MVCAVTVPSGESLPTGETLPSDEIGTVVVLIALIATLLLLSVALALWARRKRTMGKLEHLAFHMKEALMAADLRFQDEDMTFMLRLLLDQSRQKDKTIKRLKRKLNCNSSESE